MVQRIQERMKNKKIEYYTKDIPFGESIAMVLIFYLGISDGIEM